MENFDVSVLESVLHIVSQCQVPLFGVYSRAEKFWCDLSSHIQSSLQGLILLSEVETLQTLYDSLSMFCKNIKSFIDEQNTKVMEKG